VGGGILLALSALEGEKRDGHASEMPISRGKGRACSKRTSRGKSPKPEVLILLTGEWESARRGPPGEARRTEGAFCRLQN